MNWNFLRKQALLRYAQWRSPERLREFQERRLRKLIVHAYDRCAYYRRQLDDRGIHPTEIRTLSDLARLPILSRKAVAENFSELSASNAKRFRPEQGYTSGSTGPKLMFVVDRDATDMGNAVIWRFRGWHGIRFGHRIAEIRLPDPGADATTVSEYLPKAHILRLRLFGPDPQRPAAVADELVRFRPDAIRGAPSLLTWLCLYLRDRPEIQVRPRVVFAGSERLLPDHRRLFSEIFRAPVVEGYGNYEYVVFAGECPRGNMHLASEMGLVEIMKGGNRAPAGEPGGVIVTNLWNRAFPFLRYAIDDVASLEARTCLCGRGLPIWRIVGGRQKDLLATSDGYMTIGTNVIGTPRWRGKFAAIRFYQETRHEVVAQVVKGPLCTADDLEALRRELDDELAGRLRVSIQVCESIEQTVGGKHRTVVSKVPIEI
jgi:phenylacetate-CoA ligase